HALYRGQTQYVTGDSDPLVERMTTPDREFTSVAAFPLRGSADTRGVLVIHAADSDVFDDDEEVMLLGRVADTLALGLDYSWQR
ncbi:MAG: hypothetical protein GWO02_23155, partial [Gammaproteobacteria bacterium]|nr:hypothetical protein [Gammaproteobacteria bacterium]